jgi:hypothetical protein
MHVHMVGIQLRIENRVQIMGLWAGFANMQVVEYFVKICIQVVNIFSKACNLFML